VKAFRVGLKESTVWIEGTYTKDCGCLVEGVDSDDWCAVIIQDVLSEDCGDLP
jgi:hypothetical protein